MGIGGFQAGSFLAGLLVGGAGGAVAGATLVERPLGGLCPDVFELMGVVFDRPNNRLTYTLKYNGQLNARLKNVSFCEGHNDNLRLRTFDNLGNQINPSIDHGAFLNPNGIISQIGARTEINLIQGQFINDALGGVFISPGSIFSVVLDYPINTSDLICFGDFDDGYTWIFFADIQGQNDNVLWWTIRGVTIPIEVCQV